MAKCPFLPIRLALDFVRNRKIKHFHRAVLVMSRAMVKSYTDMKGFCCNLRKLQALVVIRKAGAL